MTERFITPCELPTPTWGLVKIRETKKISTTSEGINTNDTNFRILVL